MINLFEHPVLKCTFHPFMSTELKKVLRETDIMIQFSSLWYFLSFGFWHSFSKWIIQRNSPRKVPPWKKFHSHRNHFHFIKNCIFRYCTSYFNRFKILSFLARKFKLLISPIFLILAQKFKLLIFHNFFFKFWSFLRLFGHFWAKVFPSELFLSNFHFHSFILGKPLVVESVIGIITLKIAALKNLTFS